MSQGMALAAAWKRGKSMSEKNVAVRDPDAIRNILLDTKTVAVVGYSDDPGRAGHYVARYLQEAGYRVIPVNPSLKQGLGETCYPSLKAIPEDIRIDMVDCFRRPEFIPDIARDAAAIGVKVLWMQSGITSEQAREIATEAGMTVVENRCTMQEHRRLV